MYQNTKNEVSRSRLSKVKSMSIDRTHSNRGTDTTERIITPHS